MLFIDLVVEKCSNSIGRGENKKCCKWIFRRYWKGSGSLTFPRAFWWTVANSSMPFLTTKSELLSFFWDHIDIILYIISVLQTIRRSKVGNKCKTKVSWNKIITFGYSIINTRHSIKCALKILHNAMNSRILNCRDYVLKYRISNVYEDFYVMRKEKNIF